jgi:hypothetical protein
MLGPKSRDVSLDLGVLPMSLEKSTQSGPGIAKQGSVNELDGRGRPLDVQEDGARVLQLDRDRSGMYVGPMQSGW